MAIHYFSSCRAPMKPSSPKYLIVNPMLNMKKGCICPRQTIQMTIKSPTSQVFALALRIFKNHQITGMIPAINTSLVLTPPCHQPKPSCFIYLYSLHALWEVGSVYVPPT